MSQEPKVVMPAGSQVLIDGTPFSLEGASDRVKAHVASIQATDVELKRLAVQVAICQTARSAYARALKQELEQVPGGRQSGNKEAAVSKSDIAGHS